ncbi:CopG family ribbon-helix-helix protein [Halorubrum ezzemoulense]|uniref:Nickel-responsive transcriptional regulator NikR n=1 Tax=Halorubrum ezzemoulense TaxID=337243 RepID=A0A256K1H0_HALEZ|nr:nickel-responsive transcriptional regulator NikR [Halorubrum ezzemoulense]MDB2275999.1 nickel-responsive transcriptional regulator NikR [Halorubrum ezzemoulense]OYR74452.1 nickel-responsive transcriptional regulator NikR [Halorubrum ezzemoulense]
MTERLREDLDTFAEEHGYTGRSEVIREACHSLLEEYQESDYEDRRVLMTVTAVFGYDEPEIERRMMDIRHEFEGSIRSNSHNCLRGNAGCVETFVVEAAYQDVLHFIGTVRGADESVSVEYSVVPVDGNDTAASDK